MPNVKDLTKIIPSDLPQKDKELIERAYIFAENAHKGQKRESGDPYFVHVFVLISYWSTCTGLRFQAAECNLKLKRV